MTTPEIIKKKVEGLSEEDLTPFERQLAQAILAALEYRGFYDCGKYLDIDFIERIRPLLTILAQEVAEAEGERLSAYMDFVDEMAVDTPFDAAFTTLNKKLATLSPTTLTDNT